MSKIIVRKDKKGNIEDVIVENATFFYTHMRKPTAIFDDRKLPYDQARKEYSIDVAVTEEVADQWDELFAKQPSKKFTNAKFREKYKMEDDDELPVPDAKKQFIIKMTQKAQKKDGDPIGAKLIPRVFVVEEGKGKDITFETNVGNGSTGKVMVRAVANDYGLFAYLSRVKVDNLIEYNADNTAEEKDFLGVDEVELADAPEQFATSGTTRDDDDDGDDDVGDTKTPKGDETVDPDDF